MHLSGKKRKVVLGQDFPPSELLAGTKTHTHTQTQNLVTSFTHWALGLELSLKP